MHPIIHKFSETFPQVWMVTLDIERELFRLIMFPIAIDNALDWSKKLRDVPTANGKSTVPMYKLVTIQRKKKVVAFDLMI